MLNVPDNLDLAAAAPLLCAGITTFSPFKHVGLKKGDKVAVLGLGGLGHMGVKLAASFMPKSPLYRALRINELMPKLSGDQFILSTDSSKSARIRNTDYILDSFSAA